MQRVLIESGIEDTATRCRRYEYATLRDSLARGESPVSVSLLHAMIGDLNDAKPAAAALDHAFNWIHGAQAVVLYVDLGMSPRMRGLKEAGEKANVPVMLRSVEHATWE